MTDESILVERSGDVVTIRLNRPEQLNPFDFVMLSDLSRCLDEIEKDETVDLVVVRGSGRAFSAGGDLKGYLSKKGDISDMHRLNRLATRVLRKVETLEQIVIAVVDGICVAGGIEFILCCDYVIATERATFSDGHVNVAQLPGGGSTQRLPGVVGPFRAKDLMLTGRFIGGTEAAQIGLATVCVPAEDLELRLTSLVETLSEKSFAARAAIKLLVNQGLRSGLESGLLLEETYCEHFQTTHPDAHEGLLAFAEKRKPRFRRT